MYENKVMPIIKDAVQGRTAFLIRQANYITSALLDAHHSNVHSFLLMATHIAKSPNLIQTLFLGWWVSNRADVERVQMKDIIAFTLLVILPLVLFISTFWWY